MYEMVLYDPDKARLKKALDYCNEWCEKNQWAVGVGEIALGACNMDTSR